MDKSIIKSYVTSARSKLIEAVTLKARQLYIFEDSTKTLYPGTEIERLQADGIFLSYGQLAARQQLCSELSPDGIYESAVYSQLMESIACTWFNRLVALRFMEVNGYLPSGVRILSSDEPGQAGPEVMHQLDRLDYIDCGKIAELRADTGINASERIYRYILLAQCNALATILPRMFHNENGYVELLLPDCLYTKGGIIHYLVNNMSEKYFLGQVQIIGWLHQYYISETKDAIFANKRKIKISKEMIPAITQLFTPEWIVKYMIENSLGRLWLEGHPDSVLRTEWRYYVEGLSQVAEASRHPEDIKLIDPCMGSGHILVYAFDVLFRIYQSKGYSSEDIPNLIFRHNIYGLDIDDRAEQLTYFALMMKARSYSNRFFLQENIPQPMVYAIPEAEPLISKLKNSLGLSMGSSAIRACHEDLQYLAGLLSKGKDYGSALKVRREINYTRLRKYMSTQGGFENSELSWQAAKLSHAIEVAAVLGGEYDVVITNPPYMAPASFQTHWIKKNYPDSSSDLCTVFIERNFDFLRPGGYLSMLTMHSWMFLSSYEKLRKKLMNSKDIVNLVHLGARAFEEINGKVVQTAAFVMRCSNLADYSAVYVRLVDCLSKQAKEEKFLSGTNRFMVSKRVFRSIPGYPLAYWVNETILNAFGQKTVKDFGFSGTGMRTGNNELFLRKWYEVDKKDLSISLIGSDIKEVSGKKWVPYNKGGEFRKWYGNNEYVVYWENNGHAIKENTRRSYPQLGNNLGWKICNEAYYFLPGITWTVVTAGDFNCRCYGQGFIFDAGANGLFPYDETNRYYLAGLLNSVVGAYILHILNPTINYGSGVINNVPVILDMQLRERINSLVCENIEISTADWNSFETSWDFQAHPFILYKAYNIEESYSKWQSIAAARFDRLKANEIAINRAFIDIYGLHNQFAPDVSDKAITIHKAELRRDVRSFISYAIGCIFGRYSLDTPGLVSAGGCLNKSQYKTFLPTENNILPLGSHDFFHDDVSFRFIEFVGAVFGSASLNDNLSFIADALYSDGSPLDRIRRYFINDFYKDHLKTYQKRPIYWLLDGSGGTKGGRKGSFRALIYLHRYDKFTIEQVRTDYLRPLQQKCVDELRRLETLVAADINEQSSYHKEAKTLLNKLGELQSYDHLASHIVRQQIEINLDDGIKVNYQKFQGAEVPTLDGGIVKMDLLGR